ncbi:unnamed protein product [Lathyrus sativus]|nr:unnamed protein product [Lathyrus sativus]
MQVFNIVFHHVEEFVMLINCETIYGGGILTIVSGQVIDKWSMVNIHNLVNGWGYIKGMYRTWIKILDIDENLFQIRNKDDVYDFAAYACVTQVDGKMFVEHAVNGIKVKLRVLGV